MILVFRTRRILPVANLLTVVNRLRKYYLKVQTVLGEISPEELGITLTHEHILDDTRKALWSNPEDAYKRRYAFQKVKMSNLGAIQRDPTMSRDNLHFEDPTLAVRELMEFKRMGGRTIVDVTSKGITPHPNILPKALPRISKKTGLNIIAGTGFYIARGHPVWVKKTPVEDLAELMINDIAVGMEGTSVRSGIIGEVGVSVPLAATEEKVLKAAAHAHLETGCPISIHLSPPGREGFKVLDILEKGDVDLSRVNMGHLDCDSDIEYHKRIAERGCFVSYDQFGLAYEDWQDAVFLPPETPGGDRKKASLLWPRDNDRIKMVQEMIQNGYLSRLLLATDIAEKIDHKCFGGRGYDHILRNIVPGLYVAGLSGRQVDTMMIDNPKEFLAFHR
jgi:phosphotriesterase-related protein